MLAWPSYGVTLYDTSVYEPRSVYDGPAYPLAVRLAVQRELTRCGYYAGAIDGVIGPLTRHAIARFQVDHQLSVTGVIDRPLLVSLGLQ